MSPVSKLFRPVPLVLLLAALPPALQAQTPPTDPNASVPAPRSTARDDGYSMLPFTRRGYVGINLGRANYHGHCGADVLGCDDPKISGKVYTGGMFNDYLGIELGYLHMGKAERTAARGDAQGINLSLVGRVPLGTAFSAFAKGGATYGRTHVSSEQPFKLPGSSESGWGGSYGAGLGFELSRQSALVLEWERHRFHFAGDSKQDVDATTLGYMHRF